MEGTFPVTAIRSSNGIIVTHLHAKAPKTVFMESVLQALKRQSKCVRDTIGCIIIDRQLLTELKVRWHEGLFLTSATDGGLGEDIGSWSYLIFFGDDERPIIKGYSAETSSFDTMQSTREELLGMLAVEFVMMVLAQVWGVPRIKVEMRLISDSKSAIKSCNDEGKIPIGVKGVTRPDMELKMELKTREEESCWLSREVEWTKSHVDDRGEPSYETIINQMADDLATMGR